jgi:ABC-2 type transport system permease protein
MSQPAEHGVIHDIGFRHYTGPRLGRGYLLRSLYAESLRGAYGLGRSGKSKVMPFLLLAVMTIPALIIAVVATVTKADTLPVVYTQYPNSLGLAIAIFVAAQAPALVSRDLRFKVMPLYLSRPLSRQDYVLAKYAALSSAMFVLIAIPQTVLYAGALLAKLSFWAQTRDYLAGLAGAVLFALVLSGIGLLIASITPKRGFGVAAVITVLMLLGGVSAALQAITLDNDKPKLAGYLGAIDPSSLVDGVQVWLFNAEPSSQAGPPGTVGGVVFLVLTLVVIFGCYGLLLLRYRRVSAS